ncbi:hypothetical protein NUU61_005880 [Penicillium alfredii]|uniref:Uncharacterized protein n=1 Tax=Penicillium alfredii TaxID=1506179 RepID=A0A9W9K7Z8_9EURO|nr:hypothetical protein NUU61_005880 [Penicillium alfredii]
MSPRAGIDPLQTTEVTKRVVFVGYTPPHQGSPAAPGAWREEAAPGGLPPSFAKSDSPVHCWETAEGRGGPAASAPGSGGCERKWVGGHVTRVPEENDQVPRVETVPHQHFLGTGTIVRSPSAQMGSASLCRGEPDRAVRAPGGGRSPGRAWCVAPGVGILEGEGVGVSARAWQGGPATAPPQPLPGSPSPRWAGHRGPPRGVVLRGPGRRRGVASWRAGGLGRRGRPATGIECGSPEPGRRASARGPGP